jgi:hypothetical protein
LHNCFDFDGFTYDTSARTVRLRWIRNEYAGADDPSALIVDMRGVTQLSAIPRNPETPFSEVGLTPLRGVKRGK